MLHVLAVVAATIYGLGYAREVYGLARGIGQGELGLQWINVNAEAALGSWFSSILLLLTALLMLWAFLGERAAGRRNGAGWLVLALGFVYLSLDEAIGIHEAFSRLGAGLTDIWPPFAHRWTIIGLPAVIVVGLLFIPFLRALPRRTTWRLLLAGFVYVGGAVGTEMLNAVVIAEQAGYALYVILGCVEETLEVVGTLLAIWAVGAHIETELGSPALRLGDD